jgi:hypothetical protein
MEGLTMPTAPSYTRTPAARGECFHNAFFFADQNPAWDIVHGIPLGRGPIDGVRYAHAWNEITHNGVRWAYDAATDLLMPAQLFYLLGAINLSIAYTYREARELVRQTQHTGPWDFTISQAEGR